MKGFRLESAALLVQIVETKPKDGRDIKLDDRRKLGALIRGLIARGLIEYEFNIVVTEKGMEQYEQIQQMRIWR